LFIINNPCECVQANVLLTTSSIINHLKMCDSDDPGDHARGGMDLTGFLFGNIDESGQLEDDGLLDEDSKRMLSSLNRLGLGSMLSEVLEEEDILKDEEEKGT
jgi:transcription initiation factor TFIID subunit 1